jgi:tripartite-type tricarboxylate transporter receptor subunit TctC
MIRVAGLAAAAICLGAAGAAAAADYPSRVVKIVVPIAAGGPVDLVARATADHLAAALKQPFIVENRPGAGGNLGIAAAIAAPPDGYTLLAALGTMLTINPGLYRPSPFDPETQLRPISTLTTSSQLLVVHPSHPAKTLADFIALAKQKPLTYGTSGFGTPSHLTMEYLRRIASFEATPATYRGNPQLVVDLVAGQIDAGFVATAGVIQQVKDGKLRALTISSAKRSRLAPDVPTIAEAGFPGFSFDSFIMLLAPAGTPDDVCAVLEREARAAVSDPEFARRFGAQDIEGVGNSSDAARAWIGGETKRWAEFLNTAKIRID